jgi:hypothetical protein
MRKRGDPDLRSRIGNNSGIAPSIPELLPARLHD